MSTNMKPKGGYTIVDWNPRKRRFEERRAGKGAAWRDAQRGANRERQRQADTFGRRGSGAGYGSGAGGAGFAGYGARIARLGNLARGLGKTSPIGRALDVGFGLMDLWQQTQDAIPQEGWDMTGWTEVCNINPGIPRNRMKTSPNDPNLSCPITGQVPDSGVGDITMLEELTINNGIRWLGLGNRTGTVVVRMTVQEQWYREETSPTTIPRLKPIPAVVQPMPAKLRPPDPVTQEQGYPRPEVDAGDKPQPARSPATRSELERRPYEEPGTEVEPGVIIVPKPDSPADPDTPIRVPQAPKARERKWKVKDPLIAKYYGWLTEIGDGLDCFEKVLKLKEGGPLHERIMRVAERLARKVDVYDYGPARAYKVDQPLSEETMRDIMVCLVKNNAKDFVIGKANRLANHALTRNPYYRSPVGLGRGGFSQRMR